MGNRKKEFSVVELDNQPKDENVNVRLPSELLAKIKEIAKEKNLTLSSYIRITLENEVFYYDN